MNATDTKFRSRSGAARKKPITARRRASLLIAAAAVGAARRGARAGLVASPRPRRDPGDPRIAAATPMDDRADHAAHCALDGLAGRELHARPDRCTSRSAPARVYRAPNRRQMTSVIPNTKVQ
jgi:hypothetical protein